METMKKGSQFNKLWNVFEETGDNDKSVSERKYDRALFKKYKFLKVHLFLFFSFHENIRDVFNKKDPKIKTPKNSPKNICVLNDSKWPETHFGFYYFFLV